MKKLLACLLIIGTLICICSCEPEDNRPRVVDGYFTYVLQEDGTYSITATDVNDFPEEVTIPETYQGVEVTAIEDEAFARCPSLRKITVPASIVRIPYGAFYMCPELEEVELLGTLKHIGNGAFGLCEQELNIHFPGTQKQWEGISKAGNWAVETDYYVYCKDGILQ